MAVHSPITPLTSDPQSRDPLHSISGSPDFIDLFRTLRRNKREIAWITVAFTAAAALLAFVLPPKYTATASFIPPNLNNSNPLATALAGQLSAVAGADLLGSGKTSGELYAGILKSRSIAAELVKKFNLVGIYRVKKESKAEKLLGDRTNISVDPKSTIVSVSVTDKSPGLAHDLADAYMSSLRSTEGRLALGQSSQKRLFFEQQLEREKNNLADAEIELKKSQEQSGFIAPAAQTEVEIRSIAETRAQIAARQVQLAALHQSATEENPETVRLRSEIANLQEQLARIQDGSSRAANGAIPATHLPQVQLDFIRKLREVKYHEALFEILSKQYEAARLDEARDAPVLQVLDSASVPDTPSSPRRGYVIVAGVLIGLILGAAWALLKASVLQLLRDLFSAI